MKKKIYISLIILAFISIGLFLINKNTDIIRNLRVRSISQIREDDIEYSFKNSPFYKDYFSQKKIIVLNIWATWCEPCIKETPFLNELKKEMESDPNIIFLSYSIDTDSLKLQKFLATKKCNFKDITIENLQYKKSILSTLKANKNEINNSFISISSTEIPKTFIIKKGKILYQKEGIINYNEFLEKLNNLRNN
ncbi:TlpA family protein disulfide reductase [Chryseobacterium daeguense]|uniref:TlpA family protein disulfide reductase n=1 Tax=Chryseobacterium daeguense TaxID=412438 RepID=UPI00040800EE|nr:TlpA family protein disulfide reductase [Chryseobacterium daeguense]